MSLKVLGLGDNVVDKYMHSKIMYPGGNALNFAANAKILGAAASYMGVFGTDEAANHVQNTVKNLNIEMSHCKVISGENGAAKVKLENGDRIFLGSNKGGVLLENSIKLSGEDLVYIRRFDLVHTSLNSYLEQELEKIKSTGVTLSFDFSVRGTDEYFQQVCPYVDYGFVSCGDITITEMDQKAKKLLGMGCNIVVATRGPEGAFYYDDKKKLSYKPPYIDALDTMGAGDSFLTGFLLCIVQWQKNCVNGQCDADKKYDAVLAAMKKGSESAARTVMFHGGFGYGKKFSD